MKTAAWILCVMTVMAGSASASPGRAGELVRHDEFYEQSLKCAAAVDQAITPARVLRWLRSSLLGLPASKHESAVEFRPIVQTNETSTRILATLAYKF